MNPQWREVSPASIQRLCALSLLVVGCGSSSSGVTGTGGNSAGTGGATGTAGTTGTAGATGSAGKTGAAGMTGTAGSGAAGSGAAGSGGRAGSTGTGGSPTDAGADGASATCAGGGWAPGKQTINTQWGGVARQYVVYVPKNYKGTSAVPLMMVIHGAHNTPGLAESWSQMDAVSEQNGFIIVYPAALDCWKVGTTVLPGCTTADDDVGFLNNVVTEVESHACIDQKRVYVTGISNGSLHVSVYGVPLCQRFCRGWWCCRWRTMLGARAPAPDILCTRHRRYDCGLGQRRQRPRLGTT